MSAVVSGGGLTAASEIVRASDGALPGFNVSNPGGYTSPILQVSPPSGVTNPSQSLAAGSYFQLILTGSDGVLSRIELKAARGGGSTPRGFFIRTSADGFATTIASVAGVNTARPTLTAFAFDTNIPVAGSITVRIYIFAPLAGNSLEFDDLILTTSAAPIQGKASGALAPVTGGATGELRTYATAAGQLGSIGGGASGILVQPISRDPSGEWFRRITPRPFALAVDRRVFVAWAEARRFAFLSTGCTKMLIFPGKYAREVRFAEIDFAPDLATGELLRGTPQVASSGDLIISDVAISGTSVRFTLKGGSAAAAVIQRLSIVVETTSGQTLEEAARLTMLS